MPVEGSRDYDLAAQTPDGQPSGNRPGQKPPYPWIDRTLDQWKLQVTRSEALTLVSLSTPPSNPNELSIHIKNHHLQNAFDTYWNNNSHELIEDLAAVKLRPVRTGIRVTEDLRFLYTILNTPRIFDYLNFIRVIRRESQTPKGIYEIALSELNTDHKTEEQAKSGLTQLHNFFREQVQKKGTFPSLTGISDNALAIKVETSYFEPLLFNLYKTLAVLADNDILHPNKNVLNEEGLRKAFRNSEIYKNFQLQYLERRHLLPESLRLIGDIAFDSFRSRKEIVDQAISVSGTAKGTISASLWELLRELITEDTEFNRPRNPNSAAAISERKKLFSKALTQKKLLEALTGDRVKIMELYSQGLSSDKIANQLGISSSDVKYHLREAQLIAHAHFGHFR